MKLIGISVMPFIWLAFVTSALFGQQFSTIPSYPLKSEKDLDPLIQSIGQAKIILLGEASHGTKEYYEWRTRITMRLIREKGFSVVAVEGDWTDIQKINRLTIKGDTIGIKEILNSFQRWPTWIWQNQETLQFLQTLAHWNLQSKSKVALYGIDLYSFLVWNDFTLGDDTAFLRKEVKFKTCFAQYKEDAMLYSKAVAKEKRSCEDVTAAFAQNVFSHSKTASFEQQQLGLLGLYGERYFRLLASQKTISWNVRESYMTQTIKRILDYYGKNIKIIVWVHNTHAGDSRYEQNNSNGYTTLTSLLRSEMKSKNVFTVGFGSYKGTVTAAYLWYDQPRILPLLPAKQGSWEYILHSSGKGDQLLLSKQLLQVPFLNHWIEFRSTGVVNEEWSIYNPSIMPRRFDAFVFIDSTKAINPF